MGCGASQEAAPPPKLFSFRLRLIGGLNLYNNGFGMQIPGTKTSAFNFQGKSDPWVRLESETVIHKSKTILHEQNPVWNEDFIFAVNTRKPTLKVQVFDADALSKDDCIGSASISLHGLIGKEEREFWVPLTGTKANGEIGFSVIECYRTKVTAVNGKDLKKMDALSGSSDCYMTLQIGQQTRQQTATKTWTLNPVWNQSFYFYVPYKITSQLELILWDHNNVSTDNNMGWHYIALDGTPLQKPKPITTKLTKAQGEISIILEDDTTVECPEVPAATKEELAKLPPKVPQTCTFQCRVVGAYNLAAADSNFVADFMQDQAAEIWHEFHENKGTSDPFARVSCEGQVYDTNHINNTLEPTWNQMFRFVCRSRETSKLEVQLWDHDVVQNDCIGLVTIPVNMVKPGERTELWSFLDKGRGELGMELQMNFQLKCRVVSCDDLPAMDLNGMCDPYVKLTVGGTTYQTRVCHDNRAPRFDEDFRWSVATLNGLVMHIDVWDSDLMIFKRGASEDLMGQVDIPLQNLKAGIPTEMELPLALAKTQTAKIKLVLTVEIPLPASLMDTLAQKGKEAFNAAVATLTDTKALMKVIKLPDFDKKEEGVVEPFDPKVSDRPRFSRINVSVVAIRKLKNCTTKPLYVGISVPSQGQRYKTKEYSEVVNPNIGESFHFRLPTKTTAALEFTVFESNKHPYVGAWPQSFHSKAVKKLRDFNDKEGLIRGSPADNEWLPLKAADGTVVGEIIVCVTEMFRFNIRVLRAKKISTKADPYIALSCEGNNYRTQTVSKDPAKDRTEGVPGEPAWNEQFTFFTDKKGVVTFKLMDDNTAFDDHLGTASFNLGDLRRGVPKEATLTFDKGGELVVSFREEEKMGLMDRMFDAATSAAKLAAALAGDVAEAVTSGVTNLMNKLF